MQLDPFRHLVVVDSKAPVSFFAYPGKASYLVPDGCDVSTLATDDEDAEAALEALADALDAPDGGARRDRTTSGATDGRVDRRCGRRRDRCAAARGRDRVRRGPDVRACPIPDATVNAPRHTWLCLTGGAIGQGPPGRDRRRGRRARPSGARLQADGSALYTIQSLWTQAREGLDVTTVLYNNRSYSVLNMELSRVGAEPGPKAKEMLDLHRPDIDFVSIASGLGVPATRAETAEEFTDTTRAILVRARTEPHRSDRPADSLTGASARGRQHCCTPSE